MVPIAGRLTLLQPLQHKIEAKTGTLANAFRLLYAGKALDDGQPLAAYNVERESTLHATSRLRGAGKHFTFMTFKQPASGACFWSRIGS